MNQPQADAPTLRPGAVPRRNPNGSPDVSLQIVARHGPITVAELRTRIEAQFKGYPIDFECLLRSLTVTRVVAIEADICTITILGAAKLDPVNHTRGPLVDEASQAPRRVNRALPPGCIATAAVPLVAPGIDPAKLTSSPAKLSSAADNRPQPVRPGADAGLVLASRMGNQLHYRTGLVTDLAGNVLQAPKGQATYRPSHNGQERARPVFSSSH